MDRINPQMDISKKGVLLFDAFTFIDVSEDFCGQYNQMLKVDYHT